MHGQSIPPGQAPPAGGKVLVKSAAPDREKLLDLEKLKNYCLFLLKKQGFREGSCL
jgi:hypothetical protein